MKVLVVKPSSLGDIIHALPTVNLLRRRFAFARISWLVNDTLADVLTECPVVDELILFRRNRWNQPRHFGELFAFLRDLRKRRFDLVVDLQGLFRSGFVSGATAAPRRIGLSNAREGARLFYTECVQVPTARMHAVDRNLLVAQHLDAGREPVQFPLGRPKAARDAVDKFLLGNCATDADCLIALNPSARWDSKLWPLQRFGELAAAISADVPGARAVFIGSPADRACVQSIMASIGAPVVNAAGRTSLSELTELLRRCAVLVTNDSGPMHIAAAVGTPVVALFGATDPALTGPYSHSGAHHSILRSAIPCSPCFKPACRHRPPLECMTQIKVPQVLAEIAAVLKTRHGH